MQPAKSVAAILPYLKANGIYLVLDYGAGNLRNTFYLASHGFFVVATDRQPPGRPIEIGKKVIWVTMDVVASRILKKADLVLCNFVLNIIEQPKEQEDLMREIAGQLRPGGFLLLETKEKRQTMAHRINHALTREEMDALVFRFGLTPVMFLRGRSSLAVLYKKK